MDHTHSSDWTHFKDSTISADETCDFDERDEKLLRPALGSHADYTLPQVPEVTSYSEPHLETSPPKHVASSPHTSQATISLPLGLAADASNVESLPAGVSLEPSCAICGAPPWPECPHEAESLERALQQAQDRWAGVARIQDWVESSAREQIQQRFKESKAARYDAHVAHLRALPHFEALHMQNETPPADPEQLEALNAEIRSLDAAFQEDINKDWQQCCQECPAILDDLFRLVQVVLPKPPIQPGRQTRYRPQENPPVIGP